MRLSDETRRAIEAHLREAYPREGCGVVIGNEVHQQVVALPNVAARPEGAFELDPARLLTLLQRADRDGTRVLAVFHSHPDGRPELSAADRAGASPAGVPSFPDALQLVAGVSASGEVLLASFRWVDFTWRAEP